MRVLDLVTAGVLRVGTVLTARPDGVDAVGEVPRCCSCRSRSSTASVRSGLHFLLGEAPPRFQEAPKNLNLSAIRCLGPLGQIVAVSVPVESWA